MARALALGVICAPFISCVLLGLGRAARALTHHTRSTVSPADELRTAATKLRTHADAAAEDSGSTTWRASRHFPELPDSTFTALWATDAGRPLMGGGGGKGRPPAYVSAPVGDYIATMHPGVGTALADWLDSEADHGLDIDPAALTVARRINGSPS